MGHMTEARSEAVERVRGEAVERVRGEAVERVRGEAVERVRSEAVERVPSEAEGEVHAHTGAPRHLASMSRDLTEGERGERRGRGQSLEAVAHDLRDPIHTIRLAAAALAVDEVGGVQRDRLVGAILRSAEMVQGMVEDLLDVDRIEEGRLSLEPKPLDIRKLLEQTRDRFQLEAEQRNVSIDVELPPGPLPHGRADRQLLDRVLSNLIRNGLAHAGGNRITIAAAPGAGGMLRLSVRDTGRGIPPEERQKIFQRFWRKPPERAEGLGLGLSIVKGVVELHGGRVWLESEVGRGTAFHFTIPALD